MKNAAKLVVIFVFAIVGLGVVLNGVDMPLVGSAQVRPTPTPPRANAANTPGNMAANRMTNVNVAANRVTNANMGANRPAANAAPASTPTAGTGSGAAIRETFILSDDSRDEQYGKVPFNHRTHAEMKYSPDGNSVVGCVECHHTDQPRSAMKPPLVTSERSVILTMDTFRASSQKVSECRFCHFQDGDVPDGKEMPVLGDRELNNEVSYHINCNTCHDAAAKSRPVLKNKPGFATSNDCKKCHTGG